MAKAMRRDWAELIEALTILAEHPAKMAGPTNCSHDELTVCADPADFTSEQIARLALLGFHRSREQSFWSTRFGSA